MDKKNLLLGVIFVGAALALMFKSSVDRSNANPEPLQQTQPVVIGEHQPATPATTTAAAQTAGTQVASGSEAINVANLPSQILPWEDETIAPLANSYIEVRFSSRGGSVREVLMPKYQATLDSSKPYIFNEGSSIPALAFMTTPDQGLNWAPYLADFKEISRGAGPNGGQQVVFEGVLPTGLILRRSYEIALTPENAAPTWEPYQILHRTEIINPTDSTLHPGRFALSLGTAEPVSSDPRGEFLNFGTYDGSDADFIGTTNFDGGGFMSMFGGGRTPVPSISGRSNIVWASVKNQFFAAVISPKEPAHGYFTQPVQFARNEAFPEGGRGITGNIEFNPFAIEGQQTMAIESKFYVGPKEYSRLTRLGQQQDLIMQFGIFGWISKLLLTLMNWFYSVIPNYGVAIILVTILIKALLWPLTAKAANSAKKMAKIQEPLKEIKEKYKDNQQKLQQETLKLFRANKVNPLAGCLPILVQIPIFLALFWMLRSASELRYAEFIFWMKDLSQPDTIAYIGGFPINILPLLMGVTMFFQMRMTTISMDSTQAKIFKFMPFIFLIFCYNFSSGLVLYWTVQNLLTILQQYLTNKRKDAEGDVVVIPNTPTKKKFKKGK